MCGSFKSSTSRWLLALLLSLSFSLLPGSLSAQSLPSVVQSEDLLSDSEVSSLASDLAATLPEEQKQEVIKLLKNFRARQAISSQEIDLSKKALSEVQSSLNQSLNTSTVQANLLLGMESNLTTLSTSLKEERSGRLIDSIKIGVEATVVTFVLTAVAFNTIWRYAN